MAKPFDSTLKHLLEDRPADCVRLTGVETVNPIHVLNADLSTITAEADKVLRINDPQPWLMHLEFQASYEVELPARMLRYNVLLGARHALPVMSVVWLLRPEADGPSMSGQLQWRLPDGSVYLDFQYRVVRIWQKPVASLLSGGVGTLPLAPLCNDARDHLPEVIRRMERRLQTEVSHEDAVKLWADTYVLMGLRFQEPVAAELLRGVRDMKESVTYQAILREGRDEGLVEGRLKEAQAILLRLGTRRFGPPTEAITAAIEAITDVTRLEALSEQLLDVNSWPELLAEPRPKRRDGRKRPKPKKPRN